MVQRQLPRRMASRLGAPKAITATAHKLARIIHRLLKYGSEYVDKGRSISNWHTRIAQRIPVLTSYLFLSMPSPCCIGVCRDNSNKIELVSSKVSI